MEKNYFKQIEEALINQIQALNDDSLYEGEEGLAKSKEACERTKAMSIATSKFCEIQKTKLDIVKTAENSGQIYDKFLGIEQNGTL